MTLLTDATIPLTPELTAALAQPEPIWLILLFPLLSAVGLVMLVWFGILREKRSNPLLPLAGGLLAIGALMYFTLSTPPKPVTIPKALEHAATAQHMHAVGRPSYANRDGVATWTQTVIDEHATAHLLTASRAADGQITLALVDYTPPTSKG